jgi:GTP:adenosylcobinamide-phosphate guanylyltransferase
MAAHGAAVTPNAVVLAGSRGGTDPVADHAGVSDKALITIGGRTMLARVIGALHEAGIGRVAVAANAPAVVAEAAQQGAEPLAAAAGPSASTAAALTTLGAPLIVTTADHALLRAEWVRDFVARVPKAADVAAR